MKVRLSLVYQSDRFTTGTSWSLFYPLLNRGEVIILNLGRRQLGLASCSLCNARGILVTAVTSGTPTLPLQKLRWKG
jgi:hypothetical protein